VTIGQIGIGVSDVPRAVVFYRDQLGLPFLFQAPNMAFFDCAGVRLMMGPSEGAGNSIIYYKVDDIEATTQVLKSRGVVFDRDPHLVARMGDHHLWMAFFRDPDGNTLALMCEKRDHSAVSARV
jgi:catechol 2,3-dioxygenase-like lactoylglutathione lyase family enzyme